MTDFSTTVDVSPSAGSLRQTEQTIQDEIGSLAVDVESGGIDATGGGGGLSSGVAAGSLAGASDILDEEVQLATERNTLLGEIRDFSERAAMSSGDGGGGMMDTVLSFGVLSGLKGGLSSLLGTTALSSLVTSVSLKSLITRVPAFATLVTAASLTDDLVTGSLGPGDLVSSSIQLGEIMTFGLTGSDIIEGTVGAATLVAGTVQIASLVSGALSGSALAGYLGSTSIGSLLSGLSGGGSLSGLLGSIGVGSLLLPLGVGGAVGLAGFLGTVKLSNLLIDDFELTLTGTDNPQGETPSVPTGTVTPGGPTQSELMEMINNDPDSGDTEELSPAELQERGMGANTSTYSPFESSSPDTNTGGSTATQTNTTTSSSTSSGGRSNQARDSSRQQPEINHNPTYNVDLSKLERKMDRDLRKLRRKIEELEDTVESATGSRL